MKNRALRRMLMEKPMGPYVAPSTQDPRNNTAPHETNRRIRARPRAITVPRQPQHYLQLSACVLRFSVPLEGPTATTRQRDPRIVSTGLDPRELLPRDRKHGSIETTILLTFHQDRRADENRPVSSTTASVGVLRKIYSLYTGKGTARVVAGRMVSGDGSSYSVPINHLAHGPAIRLLEEGVIILPDCCDARPPWVQYWTLSPLEYLMGSSLEEFGVRNRLTWRRLCHGNVEVLGAISTGRFNDSAGSHEPPQKDSNLSANTKCLHSPFSSEESTRCSSNGGSSSRCIQPIRVNLERGMPTTILKDSSRCGPC
ncbi:LOW QUALITY PROTEIN: hypothetical protein V1477_002362 [Vespula maculifrons]|uniref:Uncharacterized protein n=1 Tax=Vespula maculifrons TaxID=7453 RepID=A0ABD2CWF9_VESMC